MLEIPLWLHTRFLFNQRRAYFAVMKLDLDLMTSLFDHDIVKMSLSTKHFISLPNIKFIRLRYSKIIVRWRAVLLYRLTINNETVYFVTLNDLHFLNGKSALCYNACGGVCRTVYRLPIIQGSNATFVAVLIAMRTSSYWPCDDRQSHRQQINGNYYGFPHCIKTITRGGSRGARAPHFWQSQFYFLHCIQCLKKYFWNWILIL